MKEVEVMALRRARKGKRRLVSNARQGREREGERDATNVTPETRTPPGATGVTEVEYAVLAMLVAPAVEMRRKSENERRRGKESIVSLKSRFRRARR